MRPRAARMRCANFAGGVALFALTALSFSPALGAQGGNSLPAAWAHWKYFRSIDLPATNTMRLVALTIPAELFSRGHRNLGDLRIIDDRGGEVPYILNIEASTQQTPTLVPRRLELSYVPGKYTQAVFDMGAQAPFHNSIDIPTTLTNFMAWAQVEISDDAREWRRTGDLQPIYAFYDKGVTGAGTLNYPETNARYIRVRIYDHAEKFPLSSVATVTYTTHVPEQQVGFSGAEARASASEQDQRTVWHADFGYALPLDRVRIDSSSQEFYRRVEIYTSDDQKDWDMAGSDEVYRFYALPPADAAAVAPVASANRGAHLRDAVSFSERTARYWRVDVDNGNDAPLADVQLQFFMTARKIVFRQEPQRRYSLVYGENQIRTAPRYDLGQVLNVAQIRRAQAVSGLGAEQVNSAWTDPRPWSERNSIVLWIAVVVAGLLLAVIAFQSLKPGAKPHSDSAHDPAAR